MPSPDEIWEKGNCRDVPDEDKDIFFPDRDVDTYSDVAARARLYCRGGDGPRCPVILECLFYGLVTEDRFGIWGGMSPRERNALRRVQTLIKYRTVQDLRSTRYYHLIENYLEQHGRQEEDL